MDHKHIYYSDGHSDLNSPFLSKHQHKMKSINDYTGETPLHIITIKEKYPNPEIMKKFASFLKEKIFKQKLVQDEHTVFLFPQLILTKVLL